MDLLSQNNWKLFQRKNLCFQISSVILKRFKLERRRIINDIIHVIIHIINIKIRIKSHAKIRVSLMSTKCFVSSIYVAVSICDWRKDLDIPFLNVSNVIRSARLNRDFRINSDLSDWQEINGSERSVRLSVFMIIRGFCRGYYSEFDYLQV